MWIFFAKLLINKLVSGFDFLPGVFKCGSGLCGSCVVAKDLRGGMSLVLAGLAAEGTTEISGVQHIDRGYDNLDLKLKFLGADVKRLAPHLAFPL